MSSVEVDPSKTTLFVGRVTIFVGGRITAVGRGFDVVMVETVVAVVVTVFTLVVGTNVQQICPCLLIILWNSWNEDEASKQVPDCCFENSSITEVLDWFSSNVENLL